MIEARFYEKENGQILCRLCPHFCKIPDGKTGLCRVRKNTGSTLYAESYGLLSSMSLDPIEKKPLYMFERGIILSVGSYGCNFRCGFCQNHEISMGTPELKSVRAEALVELAVKYRPQGNIGIAYTYNEPFISYEYVYDCAALLHSRGLKNVMVTNGFVSPEPLEEILPLIDAMNIDLKSFSPEFYKKIGGDIEVVKSNIAKASESCHVEVTTLIIPGENDSPEEMFALASWLKSVDERIPLHITRFRPRYKMSDKKETEISTVEALGKIAREQLSFVFF